MATGPTDERRNRGEISLPARVTTSDPRKGRRLPAGLPFLDNPELAELLDPTLDEDDEPRLPRAGNLRERSSLIRKSRLNIVSRGEEAGEVQLPRPAERTSPLRESATDPVLGERGESNLRNRRAPNSPSTKPRPSRRAFPGPLECLRTGWRDARRARRRRELERERERIVAGQAHLEARLGILEWRRLERRDDLRRSLGRIQRVERIHERQQERLVYVEGSVRELTREEERLRKKEQVTLERLDEQISTLEERDRHAEKRLSEIDAQITRLDNALMDLDAEDSSVIENLSDLQLAGIETDDDEERRIELEERRRAIPRQQAALEQERDELEAEAERRQREKETLYERLLALEGERRQSARHFAKAQRRLDSRREALRRRSQSTEEAARHLRRQVWEPYQEVGAHLADAGVNAPLQPYLLGGIRAMRAEVEEIDREIADLARASMAESRLEKAFCAFLCFLLVAALPAAAILALCLRQGLPQP